MAFKIEWSINAQNERIEILTFWIDKTNSRNYSKRLNQLFIENTILISKYPLIGKKTEFNGIRAQIIGDYVLFYKVKSKLIYIVSIFSSLQDPIKLKAKLK